ncbi:hypothetical protein HOLleu_04168 [Holothuria leucospilota]|uniref:Uncharacterized protein n=1 Tax=Holothuria leucospilota TaxID=206669 RepID=A0A9Q1CRN8_HOLLE|nr:hypothetical protein HOLleu_04168 [Holothuria leucospilota]
MHNAPLDKLTRKTTAAARRRNQIQGLTTRNSFMRFRPCRYTLCPFPGFMMKNELASFTTDDIFPRSLSSVLPVCEDLLSCPVRASK